MEQSQLLFSREQIIANHKGAEDLIPSTIKEFLVYVPDMMLALKNAQQGEEMTRAAHSMKGAVANVCSEPLRELAYSIELMSKQNQYSTISDSIQELESGLKQLQAQLEIYQQEFN